VTKDRSTLTDLSIKYDTGAVLPVWPLQRVQWMMKDYEGNTVRHSMAWTKHFIRKSQKNPHTPVLQWLIKKIINASILLAKS